MTDRTAQLSFTERRRIRVDFGKLHDTMEIPPLLDIQKDSYHTFLCDDKVNGVLVKSGLEAAFSSVFPIVSVSGYAELHYVSYRIAESVFNVKENVLWDAPTRVTIQHLSDGSFVVHNYNQESTDVLLNNPDAYQYFDGFTNQPISGTESIIGLQMAPRSRIWFKPDSSEEN